MGHKRSRRLPHQNADDLRPEDSRSWRQASGLESHATPPHRDRRSTVAAESNELDSTLAVTWDGRLIFHFKNRASRLQVHDLGLCVFRAQPRREFHTPVSPPREHRRLNRELRRQRLSGDLESQCIRKRSESFRRIGRRTKKYIRKLDLVVVGPR